MRGKELGARREGNPAQSGTTLIPFIVTAAVFFSFFATCASAEDSHGIINASGGWVSNATYQSVTSVGQPCPVGSASDPFYLNLSGFLQTFILNPDLDSDGDGIADENDPDNDDDGLADADELSGSGFSPETPTDPQIADTDGDGLSDWAEAFAGSNPLDSGRFLRIISMSSEADAITITWESRGGYVYELLQANTAAGILTNSVVVDTVTAEGGIGPWYETETSATNEPLSANAFYRVRVVGD